MPAYDTTFKELAKTGLADLVRFLVPGLQFAELVDLPQEFPSTLRSTDLLLKAVGHPRGTRLYMFECQVQPEPQLADLMFLRVGLARVYHSLPVSSMLLALTQEAVIPPALLYGYADERELVHEITVRKLYEEPVEPILDHAPPSVLPLCTVMERRDGDRAALLADVLLRIGRFDLTEDRRTRLLQWATTFATLHLPSLQVTLISNELYRRHPSMLQPLRDFPLLRDTFNEGKSEGNAEGLGRALLELLEVRGLRISDAVRTMVRTCTDVDRVSAWWTRALRSSSLDEIFA